MLRPLSQSAAGSLALALLLMIGSETAAAERIVIRTYNTSGVAPGEIASARRAASTILKAASVQVVWRDCSADCDDAPAAREVIVRIIPATKFTAAGLLGCSVIDLQDEAGTLATIYADRVESTANRAGIDAGTLLGRAIAHEVGHLLLGTSRHSQEGLMRARWTDGELRRGLAGDWTWSSDDRAAVHRGAVAREHRIGLTAAAIVGHQALQMP